MVEKLKDAASFLKAKITQDDLQEALMQATSEDNWQASTKELHEIANAAYNYEKWQRINDFIWDKLRKSKSWKKILKTLNLVDFLLKNGPPSILSGFKYDIYQFRSFDNYSHVSDGIDRGEAIREKAKQIVDLLSNDELLEQQRVKAKNIRQKMASVVGSNRGGYGGYGGQGGSGGWDSSTKYQSYNNKTYGGSTSNVDYGREGMGVYGDYNYNKSTLDKYKNEKTTTAKPVTLNNTYSGAGNTVNQPEKVEAKKPFEKIAPKLGKPGSKPPPKAESPVVVEKPAEKNKNTANTGGGLMDEDILFSGTSTTNTQPVQQTVQSQLADNNAFSFDFLGTSTPSQQPQQQLRQQTQQQPQQPQQQQHQHQQFQQQYQQPPPQPQPQPQQQFQQTQQFQQPQQQNQFQQQQFQVYNNQTQMYNQMGQQQMNLYGQGQGNFAGSPYQPIQGQGFGQFGMAQYMQNTPQNQQAFGYNQSMGGGYGGGQAQYSQPQQGQTSKQAPQNNQFSLSLNSQPQGKKEMKDEDDFGSFESANSQKIKWMSSDEKNLTDLTGFGDQLKGNIGGGGNRSGNQEKSNNIQIDMWSW